MLLNRGDKMSKVYVIKDGELYHARSWNRTEAYARRRTNSNTSGSSYRINFKDGYYVLISGVSNIDGVHPVYASNGSKVSGVTTRFSSDALRKMGLYNELIRNRVVNYPFNFK